MTTADPTQPSLKVAMQIRITQERLVESNMLLAQVEEAFRPSREIGERNHIAQKLKRALGPRLVGGESS